METHLKKAPPPGMVSFTTYLSTAPVVTFAFLIFMSGLYVFRFRFRSIFALGPKTQRYLTTHKIPLHKPTQNSIIEVNRYFPDPLTMTGLLVK